MQERFLKALPALLFAVAGIAVAVVIQGIHSELEADPTYVSFCNVNDTVACEPVLTSPYAKLFGVSVAIWAIGFYALVLLAAVAAFVARRAADRRKAAEALFGLAALGTLFSLYLAAVALFVLDYVCMMCGGLYVVSIGLFVSAWRLRTGMGTGPGKGADTDQQLRRVLLGGAGAGAVMVLVSFAGASSDGPLVLTADEIRTQRPDFYRWYHDRPVVEVSSDGNAHGADDAPVTIVEFSDFGCPHCARLDNSLNQLIRAHRLDVRVVFRHFPLSSRCNDAMKADAHPQACAAAAAAECAGEQGEFWRYQHLLFANQKRFGAEQLRGYAREAGLDVPKFDACMQSGEALERVRRDAAEGEKLGVQSTPTMFVNGRRFDGAPQGELLLYALTLAAAEK